MTPKRHAKEMDERVRAMLHERGCPEHVLRGGLEGLVTCWENTARAFERIYGAGMDELLNDLDGRQIVAEILDSLPAAPSAEISRRIEAADQLVRANSRIGDTCLWGAAQALKHRWTKERNWWYFAHPTQTGIGKPRDVELH